MEAGDIDMVSDLAPKKLARQLDFTAACRNSANAASPEQLSRSSEPRTPSRLQLELQLRSASSMEYDSVSLPRQSPLLVKKPPQSSLPPLERRVQVQLQLRQPWPQSPAHQSPQNQVKSSPLPPRITHLVQKPLSPDAQYFDLESPSSRVRFISEVKESTPKKQKRCNCKSTRCLKLYCECYAAGMYCDDCNCANCQNNEENKTARQEAIETTLAKNPNAFKPKIDSSPLRLREHGDEVEAIQIAGKHYKGCQCKKSGCLKKYCECFQGGILCSDNCKCKDCRNYEGSEERTALYRDGHDGLSHIQQAANAAIFGAIGSSGYGAPSASRGISVFGARKSGISMIGNGRLQQERSRASASSLPVSAADTANTTAFRYHKHRSSLANILQLQDVKKLCSLLIVSSRDAWKECEEKESKCGKPAEISNVEIAASPTIRETNHSLKDSGSSEEHFCRVRSQRDETSSSAPDVDDEKNERPISPGTLALLCDEKDSVFPEEGLPNGTSKRARSTCDNSDRQKTGHIYAVQEKLILTYFRDFLSKLVSMSGSSNDGTLLKPLQMAEAGDKHQAPTAGMETGKKRKEPNSEAYPKGTMRLPVSSTKESFEGVIGSVKFSPDPCLKVGLSIGNGQVKPKIEI